MFKSRVLLVFFPRSLSEIMICKDHVNFMKLSLTGTQFCEINLIFKITNLTKGFLKKGVTGSGLDPYYNCLNGTLYPRATPTLDKKLLKDGLVFSPSSLLETQNR